MKIKYSVILNSDVLSDSKKLITLARNNDRMKAINVAKPTNVLLGRTTLLKSDPSVFPISDIHSNTIRKICDLARAQGKTPEVQPEAALVTSQPPALRTKCGSHESDADNRTLNACNQQGRLPAAIAGGVRMTHADQALLIPDT
jgi:hypothetical protein